MKGRDFLRVSMSEEDVFEGIRRIKHVEDKLDDILLVLQGCPEKGIDGLSMKVDRTNGKVRFHTKLIFALYGFLGSVFIVAIGFLFNNMGVL